ncbi:NAD-dependent epimerase/dehydratase family protein [Jannaschia sp. R86511]|uniref:NAD-dependent epimerase/dehydratase family protein n=1 Tax=Jannaschia sp. R86511 TaxID=3093853 RepID=UPI0036D394C5
MTDVLVLGGTAWLGARVAAAWRDRGAQVTCLARGSAPVPSGTRLVRADRTTPGAYDDVVDRDWDEVVEVSWAPPLVTGALAALADRARHWTLVSSVSVYADHTVPGADESAALLPADDPTDYGRAKVAAETASTAAVGGRLLVARAGLVVGPGDGSDRFGYWVSRLALARQQGDGPVLVPTTAERWAQVVDVDDLADWLVAAGASGLTGTVDAVGPPQPLRTVLETAATVAGHRGELVAAPDDWLRAHDVAHWAGPRSLPLWLPPDHAAMARRRGEALQASLASLGLALSPLTATLERTLADERRRGLDRERRSGLARQDELALLAALDRDDG